MVLSTDDFVRLGSLRCPCHPTIPDIRPGPPQNNSPIGFAMVVTSLMVLVVDWLLFRQLRGKSASRITLIMAAFGVSLMGRNIITLIAGGNPINFTFYIPRAVEILPGVRMVPDDLAIISIAALSVFALYLFLSRTMMGKWMRATAERDFPGCSTSSRIARFSSSAHRRRRWTDVMTSMGSMPGRSFGVVKRPVVLLSLKFSKMSVCSK